MKIEDAINELKAMKPHIESGMSIVGCTAYDMAIRSLELWKEVEPDTDYDDDEFWSYSKCPMINPIAEIEGIQNMKIDKETGLRNCPFCGGKAKYETQVEVEPVIDENGAYIDGDTFYSEYVHCPNCGIYTDLYDGEGEAIAAWNRRYDSDEDDGK